MYSKVLCKEICFVLDVYHYSAQFIQTTQNCAHDHDQNILQLMLDIALMPGVFYLFEILLHLGILRSLFFP